MEQLGILDTEFKIQDSIKTTAEEHAYNEDQFFNSPLNLRTIYQRKIREDIPKAFLVGSNTAIFNPESITEASEPGETASFLEWVESCDLWHVSYEPFLLSGVYGIAYDALKKWYYIQNNPIKTYLIDETLECIKIHSIIYRIEEIYELLGSQKQEIELFLKKHEYLYPLLIEAREQISSIFGEETRTSLEVLHDPEEDFEGLFIIVKTNLSIEKSLDLLDRFDREWWLNVDYDVRKVLEVDIENIT